MSDKVQVKGWVNPDVKEAFEKFVVELHGQKYGYMSQELENALRFYTDKDRLAHIDDKLDRVLSRMDDTHTHKPSETEVKVTRISDRLHALDRTVIPADDVRRAIEDVAGADDRTIEKYHEQLKRRAVAYEHPTDKVWFVDRQEWVKTVEGYLDNNPTAQIHDVLDPYPLGFDDYERAVEREVTA